MYVNVSGHKNLIFYSISTCIATLQHNDWHSTRSNKIIWVHQYCVTTDTLLPRSVVTRSICPGRVLVRSEIERFYSATVVVATFFGIAMKFNPSISKRWTDFLAEGAVCLYFNIDSSVYACYVKWEIIYSSVKQITQESWNKHEKYQGQWN